MAFDQVAIVDQVTMIEQLGSDDFPTTGDVVYLNLSGNRLPESSPDSGS
jgi:hypothetical protein